MSDPRADFFEAATGVKKLSEFHRQSQGKLASKVIRMPTNGQMRVK